MAADNKIIESTKIAAGKRTYFLDVKLTRENLRYLKITESKKVDNGQFERNQIMIFEEDIHQIMDSLSQLKKHFRPACIEHTKSHMELSKEKHANAYAKWTKQDDELLIEMFMAGKSTDELMNIFDRNIGAITSRMEKLGL